MDGAVQRLCIRVCFATVTFPIIIFCEEIVSWCFICMLSNEMAEVLKFSLC